MNSILLCTIVICSYLQIVNGSCLSYGHSCWGAHGKRSGQLPPKKQGLPNDQLELAERWALIKLNSDIFPNKGTIQLNSKTNSVGLGGGGVVGIGPDLHDEKDENTLNNQNNNILNNSEEGDGLIIPQKQQLASLISRQRENIKRNNFGYDYDDDGSIMMMADDITNNNNNDIGRLRENNNNINLATAENSRIFRMMNPILKKLMH